MLVMKEFERREVLRRIEDDMMLKSLLKDRKNELEELLEDSAVMRYIILTTEIQSYEKALKRFSKLEDAIDIEFRRYLCSDEYRNFSCDHAIWIYKGAYFGRENGKEIYYNKYVCLECGKTIKVEDWGRFEIDNTVLKLEFEDNVVPDFVIDYYTQYYYQLLYNNTLEDARSILVDTFNKNKEKNITRMLVK